MECLLALVDVLFNQAKRHRERLQNPTLTVSRVSFRVSCGRRSGGTFMRRVDMAVTKVSGTGSTCISAGPSFFAGAGFKPGPAKEGNSMMIGVMSREWFPKNITRTLGSWLTTP